MMSLNPECRARSRSLFSRSSKTATFASEPGFWFIEATFAARLTISIRGASSDSVKRRCMVGAGRNHRRGGGASVEEKGAGDKARNPKSEIRNEEEELDPES